jgi:hypothetical protein
MQNILVTETAAQPEKYPLARRLCRLAERELSGAGRRCRTSAGARRRRQPYRGTLLEYFLIVTSPDNNKLGS